MKHNASRRGSFTSTMKALLNDWTSYLSRAMESCSHSLWTAVRTGRTEFQKERTKKQVGGWWRGG